MNSLTDVITLLFCCAFLVILVGGSSRNHPILSFDEGYSHLFGDDNLMVLKDGKSAHISLDERTGSGFVSQDIYLYGYFSASIKLPADYTAGVVVAFYMSNVDMYEKNHDEIDFEFLGNIRGKDWRIQTNIYGNGSTSIGREERYGMWFDPSEDFHKYSILWTQNQITFYVDNVPIRQIKRTEAMGGDFPSKPMSLYATIWDASSWATNGGKYKVSYKYAPYIARFPTLSSTAAPWTPSNTPPVITPSNSPPPLLLSRVKRERNCKGLEKSTCNIHTATTLHDTGLLSLSV